MAELFRLLALCLWWWNRHFSDWACTRRNDNKQRGQ